MIVTGASRRRGRARRARIGRWAGALLIAWALAGAFAEAARADAPVLHAGAIEVGLGATLTSVEGVTHWSGLARCGTFVPLGAGLAGLEAEIRYARTRSLHVVDLGGALSWQHALGSGGLSAYGALAGGLREEVLGSFRQARYPVGVNVGVRALAGDRAGVRAEYRFRRVLNDPVSDTTEHEILVGLSLFFRNTR